jgi:hypothetical protein
MNRIAVYELPYTIILPRKKTNGKVINLNLNIYRNLHYKVNNQIKQLFQPLEIQTLKKKYDKIKIEYICNRKDKRLFDLMNTVVVVDKFFCDWLVRNGYIEDDNSKVITEYTITTSDRISHINTITAVIYE